MTDLRAIDIFVRAHDEASKVFAKIAATEKAFMAEQGKSIRQRAQQVQDGAKVEAAAAKAAAVTKAREYEKAEQQIRKSQAGTTEYIKRAQTDLVQFMAKSNRRIMEMEAGRAAQESLIRTRQQVRAEDAAAKEIKRAGDVANARIAAERKFADARAALDRAEAAARSKGGVGGGIASFLFPGANDAQTTITKTRRSLNQMEQDFRNTGRVGDRELGRIGDAAHTVERRVASLSSMSRALVQNMGGLRGAFERASAAAINSGGPFRRFGSLLQIAIFLMGPIIGGLIQLAGGLFSVGAAAGVAAIGLGGVFVAALASAIPLIGLAIVAFTSLQKVLKISSQQQKNSIADIGRQNAATGSAVDTAGRLQNAQEGLIDAQRRLGDARQQAIRQLQDLADKERAAQLAAKGAALSVVDAQLALQRALSSGDALAVRHAQLDLSNAQVDNSQAQRDASRTTVDAVVTRKQGVEGSDGVIAARRSLADAERALAAAQKGSAAAAGGLAAADARLNEQIRQLTPEQRRLLAAVNEFRAVLKGPEFANITDIVTRPITGFVRGLSKALRDPQIIAALTDTAKVYSGIFSRLGDKVTGPGGRSFFEFTAREARRNGPIIEKSINSIGSIFVKVAKAASPLLTGLLQSLAKNLASADRTLTQSKLNTFFAPGGKADRSIRAFLDLFKSFGQLLGNLGGASAGSGVGMVERLTAAMDRFNERFSKDPAFRDKVIKFFQDAAKGTGDFISALGTLGAVMIKNTDPKSLEKLSKFFNDVISPTMKNLLVISNFLSKAILGILNLPFGPQIAQIAATLLILNKAFGPLSFAFSVMAKILPVLRVAFVLLRFAMIALIEGNPIALAITAIILILIILEQRFGLLTKALDFIKKHWREVWNAVSGFVVEMVTGFIKNVAIIGGKINDIYFFLDKLVKRISRFVSGAWTTVWDGFVGVISGIGDTIGSIFDGVVNAVIDGLNLIIKGINWFIGLINHLPGISHIGPLGEIGHVGGKNESNNAGTPASGRMAEGGWVPSRPGGQPRLLAEAGYDELVLSTDPKYQRRNSQLLADFHARTVASSGGNSQASPFEGDPGPGKLKPARRSTTPPGRGASGAVLHLVEMLREAQKLDSQNWPYSWGGGHGTPAQASFGIERGAHTRGFDCSGSVSHVLQAAYPGMPTMTSGMFAGYSSLFAPGPGAVTVWGNPKHVFMDIAGQRYGTGSGQPGGGFGLNSHGTGGFTPVHPKDLSKNPAGGGFIGKALNKAMGLGGGALSAFADAVGKLTDFATGFGGAFLEKFGAKPNDPITGGIYSFVKGIVAKSLHNLTAIDIPGFQDGGVVGGMAGKAQMVIAHGGEHILPKKDVDKLAKTGSTIVDTLLRGIFGNVDLSSVGLGNLAGVSKKKGQTTADLIKGIDDIANKFGLFFARLGDQIDAISSRIANMARRFAQSLNRQTFSVNPATGQVTRNTDEGFVISATQQNQGELIAERGQIQEQITRNTAGIGAGNARIAALKRREGQLVAALHKPHQSAKNRAKWTAELKAIRQAIQSAQAGVSGLETRGLDLQDSLDTNISAQADAQQQELQARLGVTANEDVQIGSSQLRGQLAGLRGDTGGQRTELGVQAKLIADKIAQLTEQQAHYGVGSPEWQQFQDAIVGNQIALEENTKAIEELSGGTALQDFSSAPWRLFRQAVFNGLGGLMPQYNIPGVNVPGAAIGANILAGGLLRVHSGETVVPAQVSRSNNWGGDTKIEINVDQAGQDLDVEYLARRMAWEARGI